MFNRGSTPRRFGRWRETIFCISSNVAIIDGDSAYNKRHKQGRFKGQSFPFGALFDFAPQPDTKIEAMGAKTLPGIFMGYHIHPGGLWSGDYLVAELQPFRRNHDVPRSKVKVHRTKEVVPNLSGKFIYPVAKWRRKALLRGDHSDHTTDPDLPALGDTSGGEDDSDDEPPRPPGSSGDLPPVPTFPPPDEVSAKAGPQSEYTETAPGTDTRGLGLETFDGRGSVRVRKGSTRPPTIPPEL